MFGGRSKLPNFKFFLTVLLSTCSLLAAEPSPAGLWKTFDDRTQKPRGLIRLYEQDGAIFGRIEASVDPKEAREICEKCSGDLKNKPVVGMVVMKGMRKQGSGYGGGEILDPDTGWVYRCKMNVEDGGKRLVVRGYLGFSVLGRSQIWLREK